jgi:hypothetical protein
MSLFDHVVQSKLDGKVVQACSPLAGEASEAAPGLDRILSCYHDLVEARSAQTGGVAQTAEGRDIINSKLAALEQAVQGTASHVSGLEHILATRGERAICMLEALQVVSNACNPSTTAIG